MKIKIRILLNVFCFACLALMSSGCLGTIARSTMTSNDSYQKVAAKAGPLASDQARVCLYLNGGYSSGGAMMFGPFTGIDFVAFNQTIYRIGGNSFFCMDLPAGDYKVVQAQPGGGFAAHFRLGTNPKTFTLKGGNEYFIRGIVSGAIIDFDLADSSQAESDLKKLDFWTKPEIGVDYKLDQ